MLTTMLRSIKELYGYAVRSTDEVIGEVLEFHLDSERWTVKSIETSEGHLPIELLEEVDTEERCLTLQEDAAEVKRRLERSVPDPAWPARRLIGLRIEALDGPVGLVEDLIVNDADLAVRYLTVAAEKGDRFIVSPWWIQSIDLASGTARYNHQETYWS